MSGFDNRQTATWAGVLVLATPVVSGATGCSRANKPQDNAGRSDSTSSISSNPPFSSPLTLRYKSSR
jgi:hypothetical protein